jgi:hypothetical protein
MSKKFYGYIAAFLLIASVSAYNVNFAMIDKTVLSAMTLVSTEALAGENGHYLNGVQRYYVGRYIPIPVSSTISGGVNLGVNANGNPNLGFNFGFSQVNALILCCTPCNNEMNGCNFELEDTKCLQHVIYTN